MTSTQETDHYFILKMEDILEVCGRNLGLRWQNCEVYEHTTLHPWVQLMVKSDLDQGNRFPSLLLFPFSLSVHGMTKYGCLSLIWKFSMDFEMCYSRISGKQLQNSHLVSDFTIFPYVFCCSWQNLPGLFKSFPQNQLLAFDFCFLKLFLCLFVCLFY